MSGGFVMVPEWLRAKKPSGNAILAYVNLGSFGTFRPKTATYDECRPSLPRLADEMGVSESTAKLALAELVKLGAAIRTRRFNPDGSPAPSLYRLVCGSLEQHTPKGVGSHMDPPGSTSDRRGGAASEPTLGSPVNGNQEPPTQNHYTKNSRSRAAAAASSSGGSAPDDDAAEKRKAKRRASTREQDRAKALELIGECGYEFTDDEINVFLRQLRTDGIYLPGAYIQGIVDKDGEDKLAALIADTWADWSADNAA